MGGGGGEWVLGVDLEDSQIKACQAPVRKVAPVSFSVAILFCLAEAVYLRESNFLLSLLLNLLEKVKYSWGDYLVLS